jgi:hypothetical protein
MNVRFKMSDKGEVVILPGKDYEALAGKAREADEDAATARLIVRARREIAAGMPLIPEEVVDRIAGGENALRVLREWRGKTQLYISHKTSIGRVIFPTWKADEERERPVARLFAMSVQRGCERRCFQTLPWS